MALLGKQALAGIALGGVACSMLAVCWMMQPFAGGHHPAPSSGTAQIDPKVLQQHVAVLADTYRERNVTRPEVLEQAAVYIEREFRRIGAATSSQIYTVEGRPYRNVIARFGPAGPPAVVAGAHYDAFQHTPGADDNASGVAGLLAIAANLAAAPPRHPVELVAYTLEEPPYFRTGHMGSRQHARALAHMEKPPQVVLILEMIGSYADHPGSQQYPFPGMDCIYPSQGNFLALVGELSSPLLVRKIKQAMSRATPLPIWSMNVPAWLPEAGKSDHISYWQEKIPAVMITDTAYLRNHTYHTAADIPAALDYTRMAQAVQAVIGAIRHFDTQENAL